MGDEFTPGAMDFSIDHFAWRKPCTRCLVVFTDEPARTGFFDSQVEARFPAFVQKVQQSGVFLFFFGPKDDMYGQLSANSRANIEDVVGHGFASKDFNLLLKRLAATVTESAKAGQGKAAIPPVGPVFDLTHVNVLKASP